MLLWTGQKAVGDPLGLAAFASALGLSSEAKILAQKRSRDTRWIMSATAAYALAATCVLGGLAVAYR